jgi:hypothetical protein
VIRRYLGGALRREKDQEEAVNECFQRFCVKVIPAVAQEQHRGRHRAGLLPGGTGPTPRQFRPLLAARGMESTIALRKRYYEKDASLLVFEQEFIYAVVDELLEQERIHDAAGITRMAEAFGRNIAQVYANKGDLQRLVLCANRLGGSARCEWLVGVDEGRLPRHDDPC